MSKPNITRSLFPAASALILAVGLPISTHAATLQNVYLISSQSSPVNVSSPPFGVNGTTVYRLNLTGTEATSYTSLGGTGLQFNVTDALTYKSHTGTINDGETDGTTAAHINQEVGVWDDVGIVNEGGDAALNLDHSGTSSVLFNRQLGFLDLIVAEDAGLDDLELSLCSDAGCTVVFSGLDGATSSSLTGLPDFSAGDSSTASEMDQAFVFRFSDDGTGVIEDVRIGAVNNYGGEALEVDFVGVGGVAFVPIPAAAWLFGSALIGLVGAARRKKAA